MRKAVALFTILALLLALPAATFAAEDKADNLESVILKVREKINIPEEYNEFSSNMRTDEDGTINWNLQWSYEQGSEYWNRGYIYVDVTDAGFIKSYSKYGGDSKYSEYVKIPSISKENADEIVKDFISKTCPEIEAELDWQEPTVHSGAYSYTFPRKVNGITMPSNRASFNVDGTTGEITNYYAD